MSTRFTEGDVTVTLSGDLEALVLDAANRASAGALPVMQGAAEQIASEARLKWYALVDRETGRGGDVRVVTFVSADMVRVSVGSTDTSAGGKSAKARVLYVHEPFALSTIERKATAAEYHKGRSAGLGPAEAGVVDVPNPKAARGRYLVPTLITNPMRKRLKPLVIELGRAIATKLVR